MSDESTSDLLRELNREVFGTQPESPLPTYLFPHPPLVNQDYAQQYDNQSFFTFDVQMPFLEMPRVSLIPQMYSAAISKRVPSPPTARFEFTGNVKNAEVSVVSCSVCNKQFLLSDKFKGSIGNAMCGGCRAGRSQ